MSQQTNKEVAGGNFHLDKWFLDFIGNYGGAMIFYAATLTWRGWSTSFTSWLSYDALSGVRLKSRFRNAQIPQRENNNITWSDPKFGIAGKWEPLAKMIQARLFDSEEGHLDWNCFQPASKVQLRINKNIFNGRGYAEQLILTVPPWRIPMDELRWGRFGSDENNIVWIELKEKDKRQWLWLNGERIKDCIIDDDHISIPEKELVLNLDRGVSLESEKKVLSVVERLISYIPGFNKVMPLNFLMADEFKWLSTGQLQMRDMALTRGMAIHELVDFKTFQP